MPYRTLNPDKIIETLYELELRLKRRFPDSGLSKVCAELHSVASAAKKKVRATSQPNFSLRTGIGLLLILGVMALFYVGSIIEVKHGAENLFGVLEGIDALINTLVVMGAGIFFLWTIESRNHRQKALDDLHELRSIIHVIDMHQLTKDPNKLPLVGTATGSREMTPFELVRYLDYCSELLSLAAKVAALYAQGTRDALVIETTSDLSQITANMASKIWQKITLVQSQIKPSDLEEQPETGAQPSASASTLADT